MTPTERMAIAQQRHSDYVANNAYGFLATKPMMGNFAPPESELDPDLDTVELDDAHGDDSALAKAFAANNKRIAANAFKFHQ